MPNVKRDGFRRRQVPMGRDDLNASACVRHQRGGGYEPVGDNAV
jgi:hypothetical protein